jgi:hypothetical protein
MMSKNTLSIRVCWSFMFLMLLQTQPKRSAKMAAVERETKLAPAVVTEERLYAAANKLNTHVSTCYAAKKKQFIDEKMMDNEIGSAASN